MGSQGEKRAYGFGVRRTNIRNRADTRRRKLINAVLYVVDSGCKWRQLPHDFPPYTTVSNFYYKAVREGLWEKILKVTVIKTRTEAGKSSEPSYALIDSQSVKTVYSSDKRGYDGEKTKGRKRHIVTDIMGNLLAVHVHAANIHDTKGGVYTFEKALYHYLSIESGCANEGYRGTFKNTFEIFHNIRIDISKQIKPVFEVMPKRWRVERTFSWLGHSRRLSKDYEIQAVDAEAMIIISHFHILLKRF